jgi:CTP-dependent riboflavin kinase
MHYIKGKKYTQSQHRKINSRHYPGTRQICVNCDEPTERCEDDGIWSEDLDGWICPECSSELEEE